MFSLSFGNAACVAGFVPSSPIYKPSVALRDGTSVKEHLLNCNRMFDTLRSISFNETVLAKGRKHAEKHGASVANITQAMLSG